MPFLTLEMLDKVVFIIIGLAALTVVLSGGRLLRFWLALAGIQIGFCLGLTFGRLIFNFAVHQLVLAIVAAALLAGLLSIFSRIGCLLACGGTLVLMADQIMRLLQLDFTGYKLYILGGAFIIGAIPGVLKIRHFIVAASAFNGGWLLSFCIGGILSDWLIDQIAAEYDHLAGSGLVLLLIGSAVLMIIGAIFQFKLTWRQLPDSKHEDAENYSQQ